MPKISQLEEKALSFWAEKVKNGQVVMTSREVSGEYIKKILTAKKLAFPLRKGLYLLKGPEQDPKEQLYLHYWEVINKILERYAPWSIRGKSALDLYLGNQIIPEKLLVRTSRKVKVRIELPFELAILVMQDEDFHPNTARSFKIVNQEINIDIPELLLFEYKGGEPDFTSFLKTQLFDHRVIEVLYQEKARPVVAQRLIRSFNKIGRAELAQKIQGIVAEYTRYRVGRQLIKTTADETSPPKPWVSRLSALISRYEKEIENNLLPQIKKIRRRALKRLLAAALKNKKYDIYHSTTIEGYQITPEEVSEVLFQYSKDKQMKDKKIDELRNKMAILGYSYAFDFTLSKIRKDFNRGDLSYDLIKELYFNLFKPSADLKIIDRFSLVAYRHQQNYIRGSRHVPPSPDKLTDLMETIEESAALIKNPIIKAILAHYFFVYIHPYVDGNGRCARLLMNYILLTSGYHWITIRAEEREQYFKALEEAHLNENILPFAKFILSFLRKD